MASSNDLKCPLCCGEEFPTMESLRAHLLNLSDKLVCPKCLERFSSIRSLANHLGMCTEPLESTNSELQSESMDVGLFTEHNNHTNESFSSARNDDDDGDEAIKIERNISLVDNETLSVLNDSDYEQIYVVANGDSNSLIMTNENDGENIYNSAERGLQDKELDAEEAEQGVYSCSTCGLSFHSVLEHIQMYHNDQDVVVQVTDAEGVKQEYNEETLNECEETKREPESNPEIDEKRDVPNMEIIGQANNERIIEQVITDKKGRTYIRRFVQVNVGSVQSAGEDVIKLSIDNGTNAPDKKFQCKLCPSQLKNVKSLNSHMRLHRKPTVIKNKEGIDEEKKGAAFSCEECHTVFATNKSLRLHARMHLPIKPRPLDTPLEGWEGELDEAFTCKVCSKRIHIAYKSAHENHHATEANNQHACNICNRKFSTAAALDMHTNIHRTQPTAVKPGNEDKGLPYACAFCNRTFARPHEKVKHERVHTGEKPHSCDICGKRFRVAYCLTLHLRTHSGARPYACPNCPKRFKAQSVFTHHMLTHSDERAYKCPYCPKAFKTSVQLSGHKNSHTKPFSCTKCNRPFSSLYAVRSHMAIHLKSNSLRYACRVCGATYARSFALKDHITAAHPDYDDPIGEMEPITNEVSDVIFSDNLQGGDLDLVLKNVE